MQHTDSRKIFDSGLRMLDSAIQNPESRIKNRGTRPHHAFALYEVLLGLAVFAIGILALGRAAQDCLNASTLSTTEDRVRQILANRMAEIQTKPGPPDVSQQSKIDTGYGIVKLTQKSVPADFKDDQNRVLSGINLVTLTAQWEAGGVTQSRSIEFYVYRAG